MLGKLISGFITILVGVTLIPTIGTGVKTATVHSNGTSPTNVTGAAETVTKLVTLFFALGVMSAGIAIAIGGLKDAGLV